MSMHSNREPAPRVLLVDHSADDRLLMSLYLRRSGVEILTASNGEEALQITAAKLPDLVVLDLMMQGMSGFEVCKRIKSNPATALTPVVFLTAADNREDRIKGLQAGADDFFSKQVQRDEFLVRVKSLLATHQARKQEVVARQAIETDAPQSPQSFERSVPRRLMDRILATPEVNGDAPGGYQSRFNAVILFADLRGFTRMAEQLVPTEVVLLLNQYFSLLTEVTYRYEGVIFNMAGDSLLVGFGVPFEQADAAERAIKCGNDMLTEFETLSSKWKEKYGLETGLGIGVNKGEVVAGNVGSLAYMNFTIIGDAVNIASRLMQRARAGELLLSERVMLALLAARFKVDAIPLPPLTLRGRSEPIGLYCIPFKGRIDTR
ncbi:MAG TPA: adenylate/guanylate cyclase domain-containing protein [Burkholderiales bacterium]|nr:adenylate/guanylate cyclase domain-containing protein [Burkholderiales bacterium]